MFWDFGLAAGDYVQKSASRDPQQSQDPQQNPLPESTSEGTDGEKIYEIIRGNSIRAGAECFRCTDFATHFYRTS